MASYSVTDLQSLHPTTRYAAEVVAGMRTVCHNEFLACRRHLDDLKKSEEPDWPYVFDETRANRIFDWFAKVCRHVRGPLSGQPIILEPFQKFDLGCIFGWVRKTDGKRRFKKAFNFKARGNVKSTEASAIGNYGMCGDVMYPPGHPELSRFEENPEVECAAVDKQQAKRVWGDAVAMAKASPDIMKRLKVRRTYVEHITRGGWLRALSRDTKNKDSGAPCIVIVDEYHAQPTSEIHDVLLSGFGKRAQSLMLIISTAGSDAVNNPCKREYDICIKVLNDEIQADDQFVMIRELDPMDSPHDRSCWVKANPILQGENEYAAGLLDEIESEYNIAYGSGDYSKLREFLTKRMNRWQADAENKYMAGIMDKWDALAMPRDELMAMLRGSECVAGFDLSKRTDLTGDGYIHKLPDGKLAIVAHGYIASEAVTRHEQTDRVEYRAWAADGWVTITDGPVVDYSHIRNRLYDYETVHSWKVVELEYDPAEATYFMAQLREEGYECNEVRQGNLTLSEPTKRFRELVLSGEIVHDGSPVLRWCLSNAVEVSNNGGLIRLSKKNKDDSQRIDLAAAVMNAMVRVDVLTNDLNSYVGSDSWGL